MKSLYHIAFLLILFIAFASCDSYLDMKPIDPPQTAEDIFSKADNVEKYLNNVYSFIPREWLNGPDQGNGGLPYLPASDETEVSFNNNWLKLIDGSWTPSSGSQYDKWGHFYYGIREANYFLQNIDLCKDPNLSEERKDQFKAEARFLRAYFYYYLIRMYGPVCLMGDQVTDPNDNLHFGRSPLDECVAYVDQELKAVSEILVAEQPYTSYIGRPTSGVALALRSRLLLHVASPLFNNQGPSLYAGWKSNVNGEDLVTQSYDAEKWKKAADAALELIQTDKYQLYKVYRTENREGEEVEVIDPYQSLSKAFFDLNSKEIIWGVNMRSDATYYQRCTPRGVQNQAWGGFGVTQQHVDAYAMASGRYPIEPVYTNTGYQPNILPQTETGYNEEGFTPGFVHPWDGLTNGIDIYNMYVNREPRFYVNITWSGMKYPHSVIGDTPTEANSVVVGFYIGGNSGLTSDAAQRNYSLTGYTVRKLNPRENNLSNNPQWTFFLWPYIRLAEIYLNYTEAMIEYAPSSLDYQYWDELRARAGLLSIRTVYPGIENDQNKLREMIRRERQVELAFESFRFFDVRRWQIAEQTDMGAMFGMNIMSNNHNSGGDFWKRTTTSRSNRVFNRKQYLWPMLQRHMDRDNLIEQAPFWN
jgi:hypothetical protein